MVDFPSRGTSARDCVRNLFLVALSYLMAVWAKCWLASNRSNKFALPLGNKNPTNKLHFLCDNPTKLQKILHQLQVWSKFVTSKKRCQVAYGEFSIFGTINQQRFGTQSSVSTNPFAEILLVKGGLASSKRWPCDPGIPIYSRWCFPWPGLFLPCSVPLNSIWHIYIYI